VTRHLPVSAPFTPEFRWSLRVKWLLFLAALILLFLAASLFWIRRPIEASYRDSFRQQYAQRIEQTDNARETRRDQQIETFGSLLQNPRLIAALQAEDRSQFYYDLVTLAEPVFRQHIGGEPGPRPFLRYLHWEDRDFRPPDALRESFGIASTPSEAQLEEKLSPLSQRDAPDIKPRVGILELEGEMEPHLFETYVIPLADYYGEFWGDIIFCLPVLTQSRFDSTSAGAGTLVQTMLTRRQVYLDRQIGLDPGLILEQLPAPGERTVENLRTFQAKDVRWAGILHPIEEKKNFTSVWQMSLFSTRDQEYLINNIRATLIGITSVFGIVAILLGLWTIRQFTRPLDDLVEGTRAVRANELEHRIPIRTRDELGHLAESFNQMIGDLELKNRYRAVLDKVTDVQVADQLTSGQIALGGERRPGTIFFCDIRSFTPWSAGLSPEELIEALNRHMTAMTECVHDAGGVVDKFIGDELMALFGLPTKTESPEEKAVECALNMLRRRKELNEEFGEKLEVGIGMASGEVIAGCMGSEDRLNYTVIGPVVNLASRLCSAAPAGSCYVDRLTAETTGDNRLVASSSQKLKGFDEEVEIFELRPR